MLVFSVTPFNASPIYKYPFSYQPKRSVFDTMRFTPKQRLFEEFRLLSTLKRPKMLIEATEYDACLVSVFKSLCFYLSTLEKECFQNAPFSEAFSKASVFISVFCRFSVDVRRSMCFQMNPDFPPARRKGMRLRMQALAVSPTP